MRNPRSTATKLAVALPKLALLIFGPAAALYADNWPQWRGPQGTGVSAETNLPVKWSPTENVRWHIPLAERGNSTPITWGSKIFLTQPVERENRRTVMCLDRATGKLLWQSGVTVSEKESTHQTNPYCSASPVTDGERVIAWFGSAGLYCYDMDGRELWHRDLGPQDHIWGYGSSPVLYGDLCIVNFGPGKHMFMVAVNKKTGEPVWQDEIPQPQAEVKPADDNAQRDLEKNPELYGSWTTPLVIRAGERDELVVNLPRRVVAYDPATGKKLWYCNGLSDLAYASPIWGDGVVVSLGGYYGSSLAVKPGGSGDVTDQRLWHIPRSKLRLGTGVIVDRHLYITDMQGIAECSDLATGKPIWEERLSAPGGKGDTWSSMVLSEGKIYLLNQSGDAFVYKASPTFELLATNSLGESTNSSIAISDGELLIRTHQALWCISEKKTH